MGARILVDDGLELLARRRGTLLRRREAVRTGLCRYPRRTHRRFPGADRGRKLGASLFVLRVDVVPAAKGDRAKNDNRNHSGNEFRLVFDAPVSGVSRRLECDLAEAVLFQLMPGFCAHRLPSSLRGRMTIVQFNRGISGASKRLSSVNDRGAESGFSDNLRNALRQQLFERSLLLRVLK